MLRTLAEEGVSPILINSHVTPLSLFKQFFDHRVRRSLCSSMMWTRYSPVCLASECFVVLCGATPGLCITDQANYPLKLPSSFIFESRLIFAANVIPRKNDAYKAVLSRCECLRAERQPG